MCVFTELLLERFFPRSFLCTVCGRCSTHCHIPICCLSTWTGFCKFISFVEEGHLSAYFLEAAKGNLSQHHGMNGSPGIHEPDDLNCLGTLSAMQDSPGASPHYSLCSALAVAKFKPRSAVL